MKNILYIFFLSFFVACTSNTIYKKPNDLIPKDTMVLLLKDMYIAESAKYIKNIDLQTNVNYMPLVYNKYKIDSLRFEKSNTYYTSKMEVYEEILKKVVKALEKQKETYQKELKVTDSILDEVDLERVVLDSLGSGIESLLLDDSISDKELLKARRENALKKLDSIKKLREEAK